MTDLSFCTVEGYRMAYRRSGRGEPAVLIHGITTSSFVWRSVGPLLEHGSDIVAVDLLGCGGSDLSLDADYSITAQAELVAGVIRELAACPCHLVGHDIGGGIAQILAVRHPELLGTLTLVNPVGYDFWPVQPIIAMRTPILRQLIMATIDRGMLRLVVKRALHHRERLDDELMGLFWDQMKTTERRKAFLKLARALDSSHLTAIEDQLRTIEIPTLILRGDDDVYLSPEICTRLRDDIPGSRLERIDTGGHFVQIDEPEWVARHLQRLFNESPA